MLSSGIGGSSGVSWLRHRASSQTSDLGTSLIGANPPALSPYSVEKPVASSLLLPVTRTRWPCSFDRAMSVVPRTRACRFSTDRPVSSTSARQASTTVPIGTSDQCSPWRLARSSASVTECSELQALGMPTTCTASAPSASQAIVATSAESMPPDSPRTTERKPFLRT